MYHWTLDPQALPALERLAELLALHVRSGDLILLEGDLGAGKTTFARAFVRALAADPELEVPSPTFALLQSYVTARATVHHFDLYRLGGPAEVREIGFEEAQATGLVLVEWPDRAGDLLPFSSTGCFFQLAGNKTIDRQQILNQDCQIQASEMSR